MLTDLAKQMLSMDYSWDKTTSNKPKLYWMEEENHNSLLLHCGQEANRLDMREKEAHSVITLPDWSIEDNICYNTRQVVMGGNNTNTPSTSPSTL